MILQICFYYIYRLTKKGALDCLKRTWLYSSTQNLDLCRWLCWDLRNMPEPTLVQPDSTSALMLIIISITIVFALISLIWRVNSCFLQYGLVSYSFCNSVPGLLLLFSNIVSLALTDIENDVRGLLSSSILWQYQHNTLFLKVNIMEKMENHTFQFWLPRKFIWRHMYFAFEHQWNTVIL